MLRECSPAEHAGEHFRGWVSDTEKWHRWTRIHTTQIKKLPT